MRILKINYFLLLIISLTSLLFACDKEEDDTSQNNTNQNNTNNTLSNEEKLTSKSWTSYKVLNSGSDVTSSSSTMSINFNSNGSFSASSFVGGSGGSWTLSGSSLDLGSAGNWTVVELTISSLKIKDSSGVVEIHFN